MSEAQPFNCFRVDSGLMSEIEFSLRSNSISLVRSASGSMSDIELKPRLNRSNSERAS